MTAPKFITMKGSSHLTDKPFYVGLVQRESVMTRKETYAHLAAKLKFSEARFSVPACSSINRALLHHHRLQQ